MIPVTKAFQAPQEEYNRYLKGIWERNHLTNHGPLLRDLEQQLQRKLNVEHLSFVSNGTVALQIAIKAFNLSGEIITTPFSYVATTSSIAWQNCTPVYVDIDPLSWNIDTNKIEEKITQNTQAILVTHVFGVPCDIEALQEIAEKHNLILIFDAAHAFGVNYKNKSILNYGHASTLSFHATKLFHTIEGGAIITTSVDKATAFNYLRNFGHDGQEAFYGIGINGKASEFNAAMGLTNLPYVDEIIEKRKNDHQLYSTELEGTPIQRQQIDFETTQYNYAYYPIVLSSEDKVKKVQEVMASKNIFPRRYFYPSLNKLPYVEHINMPIAEDISSRILCLPLYFEMTKEEIKQVCVLLKEII